VQDIPARSRRTLDVSQTLALITERLAALAGSDDPRPLVLGRVLAIPDAPALPSVIDFRSSISRSVLRTLILWRKHGRVPTALPLRLHVQALMATVEVADAWSIE